VRGSWRSEAASLDVSSIEDEEDESEEELEDVNDERPEEDPVGEDGGEGLWEAGEWRPPPLDERGRRCFSALS
jgi:hypothetical protein